MNTQENKEKAIKLWKIIAQNENADVYIINNDFIALKSNHYGNEMCRISSYYKDNSLFLNTKFFHSEKSYIMVMHLCNLFSFEKKGKWGN